MRPEDLKQPFLKEERHLLIKDRIFFVPARCSYENYSFPGWEHEDIFGNDNPVHLEYCSGNGAWIAEKALVHPERNWVAVERNFSRARKIWAKLKNQNLKNLFVVCGEANFVTQKFIPENSISHCYVNFPDPWPKRRHAKYRLFQSNFIREIGRVLKQNASWDFVTDDTSYSQWTISKVYSEKLFVSVFPEPYFVTEQIEYGTSYFDALWREKGRMIRYHRFQKCL